MKKKTIALILVLCLGLGTAVGGTLAWLTDSTEEVKNTFTVGNIDIELAESPDLDLKMIPGYTIKKDPKVTVKANSEKCYVFVKVDKSDNLGDYITYTIADGWNALDGVDGVYYRIVESKTDDQPFAVLKDNQVTVLDTVTKEMMTAAETAQPTLTFTAYACQYMKNNTENHTAAEAWALCNPTT